MTTFWIDLTLTLAASAIAASLIAIAMRRSKDFRDGFG